MVVQSSRPRVASLVWTLAMVALASSAAPIGTWVNSETAATTPATPIATVPNPTAQSSCSHCELGQPGLAPPHLVRPGPAFISNTGLVGRQDSAASVYSIRFVESGWSGGFWAVELEGAHTQNSESATLSFSTVANGTYSYRVLCICGLLSPTIPTGSVVVDGANATVNVTFVEATEVTFIPMGLPGSLNWGVLVSGTVTLSNGSQVGPFIETANSTTPSFAGMLLPNGTYSYIGEATGFSSNGVSIIVHLGSEYAVDVSFTAPAGFMIFGQPGWLVVVAAVAAGLAASGWIVAATVRRGNRPPADPPSSPPAP